jgi:hypothetical protein
LDNLLCVGIYYSAKRYYMVRSVDTLQRLFFDLVKSDSLWDICDTAYALLENPVFVTDPIHTVLAYTKCVEIDDALWQSGIVGGNLGGRTLTENEEMRINHKISEAEDRPVMVSPSGPFKYARIVRTITDRGVTIGHIVDSGTFRDCNSDDVDLMEIISSLAKPLMLKRYCNHLENAKPKGNFFIGLLGGLIGENEIIDKRMKNLRMKQFPYWYVFVFAPMHKGSIEHSTKDIVREISFSAKCDAFVYDDHIACVMGSDKPVGDWRESYPLLYELIAKRDLAVGVSRRFSSLFDARANYIEALGALETGVILSHASPYMLVDDLAIYRLFHSASVGGELSACCSQKIRDLDAYDKAHNLDLCMTLQVYFENGFSLPRTAEILFVHKNTVRYRIEKCMTLLFGNSDKRGDFFSTLMSLRILEYEYKFLKR